MNPTTEPLVTQLLIEEWREQAQVPKPTALGTPLRYSSAHNCERQWAYNAFDAQPTEPVDASGAWVMGVGTVIHEQVQAAIARRYPDAEFEVPTKHGDYVSGSCDAFIPNTELGNVLFELKTMGTFSFDKQIGLKRMGRKMVEPEGPKPAAIAQAGMNALGIEKERGITIDTLILGSLTFEAVSKNSARDLGMRDLDRVMAEFHIPRSVWEPAAQAELARMQTAHDQIEFGFLPRRFAVDDGGTIIELDPFGRNWQCDYCAFRTTCVNDGAAPVAVTESKMIQRKAS